MTCKSEEHREPERRRDSTRDPTRPSESSQAFQRSWVIELVALVVLFAAYNVIRGSAGNERPGRDRARSPTSSAIEGLALRPPRGAPQRVDADRHPGSRSVSCYLYALHALRGDAVIVFFMSRRLEAVGSTGAATGRWSSRRGSPSSSTRSTRRLRLTDARHRDRRHHGSLLQLRLVGWSGVGAQGNRRRHQPVRRDAVDALRLGSLVRDPDVGLPARVFRVLAVAYPTVLLSSSSATGNHFSWTS